MTQNEFDQLNDMEKEMAILRMMNDDIKVAVYAHMREWYDNGRMPLTKKLYESGRNKK